MKTINNPHNQWNELIFENRNKLYGAYYLRETYNERVIRSLFFAFLFITIVIAAPLITSHYFSKAIAEVPRVPIIFNMTNVDVPATKPKAPEMKKHQNTTHPKQNAPMVASIDSTQNKTEEQHPEIVLVSTTAVTEAGTNDKGTLSTEATGANSGSTELPVVPPQVRKEWEVDKMPEFPGGTKAFYDYMQKYIRYPNIDRETEGTVYVSFVINSDGTVTDVKLLHGIGHEFDEEAMQAIGKMPKWKPGIYHNESVSTVLQVPVKFVLEK